MGQRWSLFMFIHLFFFIYFENIFWLLIYGKKKLDASFPRHYSLHNSAMIYCCIGDPNQLDG